MVWRNYTEAGRREDGRRAGKAVGQKKTRAEGGKNKKVRKGLKAVAVQERTRKE